MTARERFVRTFRDGAIGCPPRFEREIRAEVVEAWRGQGLAPDCSPEERFGLDRWQLAGIYGRPEITLRARPDLRGPVRTPADIPEWRTHFDPADRLDPDWESQTAELVDRDWAMGLHVWRGMFLNCGVSNGASLVDHLYFLTDYPDDLAAMLRWLADWTVDLVAPVLPGLECDFLLCGEPIAGNDKPVIGPATARRFLLPVYRSLVEMGRRAGIELFIWESYGQVEVLLPVVVEAGFNILWIGEACASGTDYVSLRRRLGPEIGLIGGIDARSLLGPPAAVRDAVRRVAEPLLAGGRYAPMADSRIREHVPYAGYLAYREAVDELIAEAS